AVRDFDPAAVPSTAPDDPLARLADATRAAFREAMDDDLNTPVALSHLFELARAINRGQDQGAPRGASAYAQATLKELAGVLGLTLEDAALPANAAVAPFVDLLLEVRSELRQQRLWDLADRIRIRLGELGIRVEDTPQGTVWRRE
ncbi:MAG: cysteine--tRNA ligase, partial [Sphaerobacter sp.]|nr:cysteine--tRNA ligase [Sphaerobacter sp.]